MALAFLYDDNPDSVALMMQLLKHQFQWVEGEDLEARARWVVRYAHLFQIWRDKEFIGYFALVEYRRGRAAFHFGLMPDCRGVAQIMREGWRYACKFARLQGVRLVFAYIPIEQRNIQRLARIFHFRQFNSKLWADPHQSSSQFQNKRHSQKWRTRLLSRQAMTSNVC